MEDQPTTRAARWRARFEWATDAAASAAPGPADGAARRVTCPACGTELPPALLACPRCGRLVHADRLNALAAAARSATDRDDPTAALASVARVLDAAPRRVATARRHPRQGFGPQSHRRLRGHAPAPPRHCATTAPRTRPASARRGRRRRDRAAAVEVQVRRRLRAHQGQAAAAGADQVEHAVLDDRCRSACTGPLWGWQFALGLVLSIYVHEMGHVVALRRYGFNATAPMFIPGSGRADPPQAAPRQRARGRARSAWPARSAAWRGAGVLRAVAADGPRQLRRHRAGRRLGEPLQSPARLPAGRGRGCARCRAGPALARRRRAGAAWYFTHEGLLALLLVVSALLRSPSAATPRVTPPRSCNTSAWSRSFPPSRCCPCRSTDSVLPASGHRRADPRGYASTPRTREQSACATLTRSPRASTASASSGRSTASRSTSS